MSSGRQKSNPYIMMQKLDTVAKLLDGIRYTIDQRDSNHELWVRTDYYLVNALADITNAHLLLQEIKDYNKAKEAEKI